MGQFNNGKYRGDATALVTSMFNEGFRDDGGGPIFPPDALLTESSNPILVESGINLLADGY